MAQWHVSGSDSESDQGAETKVEFGGLLIPPSRVLELLQSTEKRKTAELECLSDVKRKDRSKKMKPKRSKPKAPSPGCVKSLEEVSETASEIRSTISTNSYKEGRKQNLSRYEFSDSFPALTGHSAAAKTSGKLPRFKKQRVKKVAKLENIDYDWTENYTDGVTGPALAAATSKENQEMADENHTTLEPPSSLFHTNSNHHHATPTLREGSPMEVGDNHHPHNLTGEETAIVKPFFPSFGDSDDSPGSDGEISNSLLSQINRIQQKLLLDAEGLS